MKPPGTIRWEFFFGCLKSKGPRWRILQHDWNMGCFKFHSLRAKVRVDLRSSKTWKAQAAQVMSFLASAVCWGYFCEEKWWFWAPSMLEKWRDLDCILEGFQFWFEWINSSFMHFNVFHALLFTPTRKPPTQIFRIGTITKTSSATPSDGVVLRWFDMGKMTQGVNY